MGRPSKHKVRLNNITNLENLMQEVYNDCNFQIKEAQSKINELQNESDPVDTTELVAVTKEKTNLLKIKDSSIKVKLDLAKLQNDIIKSQGDNPEKPNETAISGVGVATTSDFSAIQEMIKKNKIENVKLK